LFTNLRLRLTKHEFFCHKSDLPFRNVARDQYAISNNRVTSYLNILVFSGTIYEILSAPVSFFEALIGYVGAAATKSFVVGVIILLTANFFVDLEIQHPIWMLTFLVLTCISFSLFGFIIGLWADSFEKLQIVPILVITPLVFLGGSFYSISMLPPFWQNVSLFNPVVYLVSGFRWSFFEVSDVNVWTSLSMILIFLAICLGIVSWMFKTGYKLKN